MNNLTLVLIAILGIIIGTYSTFISSFVGFSFSSMMVTLLYYAVVAIVFRKFRFVLAISFTFLFLILFLSFRFYGSLSKFALISLLNSHALPIIMFTYVLVPFSFLALSVDFYSAVNYLPRYFGRGVILPILIKRELIRERYYTIIKSLYARGVSVSGMRHISKLNLWLFPLIRTTIMEGVESNEYNSMLKSKIQQFKPHTERSSLSTTDKFYLTIITFVLMFRIIL